MAKVIDLADFKSSRPVRPSRSSRSMAKIIDIADFKSSPAKVRAATLREMADLVEAGSIRGLSLVYVTADESIQFLHGFESAAEMLAWSEALHDDAKVHVWEEN